MQQGLVATFSDGARGARARGRIATRRAPANTAGKRCHQPFACFDELLYLHLYLLLMFC